MRFAQIDTATTLYLDLPKRPSAAGTYTVLDRGGSVQQSSAAASLDSVNTTLSGAAAAGAQSVSVTSATGITVGRRYLVGTSEVTGGEWVTVSSVSGTTVTLARRLRRAQASGLAFASTRVSFSVPALTTPARNYRVRYAWPVADEVADVDLPFDVTRYTPVTHLSTEDLRDLDPLIGKRVAEGLWLPAILAEAWDQLLRHVAQKLDPGAVVGTVDLTTPHGYLTRALIAETSGADEEAAAYRALMADRYAQERDAVLGSLAIDLGQSGAATSPPYSRGIRLMRG